MLKILWPKNGQDWDHSNSWKSVKITSRSCIEVMNWGWKLHFFLKNCPFLAFFVYFLSSLSLECIANKNKNSQRDWDFSDFYHPLIQIKIETESWIIFSKAETETQSLKYKPIHLRLRFNSIFFPVMYWGWDQMIIFFLDSCKAEL